MSAMTDDTRRTAAERQMTRDEAIEWLSGRAVKHRHSAQVAIECGMPGSAPVFTDEASRYQTCADQLATQGAEIARLRTALEERDVLATRLKLIAQAARDASLSDGACRNAVVLIADPRARIR